MKAMILAAGVGRRMQPLTDTTPKPLLEVGEKPLIVWHIERLRDAGFKEIVINIAHLGGRIVEYLGDGSRYGVEIAYSDESEEGGLETAGGIVKALPLLSNTFLVVNGDVWTDYPFDREYTLKKGALANIVLVENPPHHIGGDFYMQERQQKYTFAGIGYYSKRAFLALGHRRLKLAPVLFNLERRGRLSKEYYGGEWFDIGTPKRLNELDKKLLFLNRY